MFKWDKKLQVRVFCFIFFGLIPLFTYIHKGKVLDSISRIIGVQILSPSEIENKTCNQYICYQKYYFERNNNLFGSWVGFSGFSSEGKVFNKSDFELLTQFLGEELNNPNYFRFSLQQLSHQEKSPIILVSKNLIGSARIGAVSPKIYVGEYQKLEILKSIYDLFNSHIFILQALLIGFFSFFLVFSGEIKTNKKIGEIFFEAIISALVLITYGHYFSSALFFAGVSFDLLLTINRSLLFGYIFYMFWRERFFYLLPLVGLFFLSSIFPWDGQASFVAYVNRYLSIIIVLAISWKTFKSPQKISLVILPYLFHDLFLMFKLPLPLFENTIFMTSFLLIFYISHENSIINFVTSNLSLHKKRSVDGKIQKIEKLMQENPELQIQLASITQALKEDLKYFEVSICLSNSGDPVIVKIIQDQIKIYRDGLLPPVFARVLQTGVGYWLKGDSEFDQLRATQGRSGTEVENYNCLSIVHPLKSTKKVYGAISITSIPVYLSQDLYEQDILRLVLESYSRWLVSIFEAREIEDNENEKKMMLNLKDEVIKTCHDSDNFPSSFNSAIEILSKKLEKRVIIFKVTKDLDLNIQYVSQNVQRNVAEAWRKTPFKLKKENMLGPFPVAYHEKKPVIIPNIYNFRSILSKLSLELMETTKSKSLSVFPWNFSIEEYLIVFFDQFEDKYQTVSPAIIEIIYHTLNFYFEHFNIRKELLEADQLISKFASAPLIEALKKVEEDGRVLVGSKSHASIMLYDLRGSTVGSTLYSDPEVLAQKYARIFSDISDMAFELGAQFEKSNGDGVVLTLKGDIFNIEDHSLKLLCQCFEYIFERATVELSIKGVVAVLHHGMIFQGVFGNSHRVGWENYGRDINIAFDVEKQAKKIEGTVFAISCKFESALMKIFDQHTLFSSLRSHKVGENDASFFAFDIFQVQKICFYYLGDGRSESDLAS